AFVCEQRGEYPKKAMTIMQVWAVLFAFVGIQMAWNLQPFVGDRGEPFQLFRHNEGNFYTAVVYSLGKLGQPGEKPVPDTRSDLPTPSIGIMPDIRVPASPDTGRARAPR